MRTRGGAAPTVRAGETGTTTVFRADEFVVAQLVILEDDTIGVVQIVSDVVELRIIEYKEQGKDLVISRRALIEDEEREHRQQIKA